MALQQRIVIPERWEMIGATLNNCLKFPDYNTERYNPGRVQEIA